MRQNTRVKYSAKKYEEYTSDYTKPWDEIIVKRVFDEFKKLPSNNHAVLVDVGTGTAALLVQIARTPGLEDLKLVGSDYFDDMIEEATARVASEKLKEKIKIVKCDSHDLSFPENYADLVISRSTLHHFAKPSQALQEMYRILKPGGVAIIHDVRRDPPKAAIDAFNALRAKIGVPPSNLEEKYTVADVKEMLKKQGLEDCSEVTWTDEGLASLGFEVLIKKLKHPHPA